MVSIIIPLYNKSATIERAIRSVLKQTVTDFELLVVDNGSTDGGAGVVQTIEDGRIKLISHTDRGVSKARNRGIAEARSEWVTFLDADDEWEPTFLATCQRLGEEFPQCEVRATAYRRSYSDGRKQDIILAHCPADRDFVMDNYFEVASHSDPPFCSISVMIRKEALLAVGGFPDGIHQGEDLLTWARLASRYKIAYCREPQSIFHTGESTSMDAPRRLPAYDDPVGRGLEALYAQTPELKGLGHYIAQWHKMRASIYLRLPGMSRHCRQEIATSQRWHKNRRLCIYKLLSYLPYALRMRLLHTIAK